MPKGIGKVAWRSLSKLVFPTLRSRSRRMPMLGLEVLSSRGCLLFFGALCRGLRRLLAWNVCARSARLERNSKRRVMRCDAMRHRSSSLVLVVVITVKLGWCVCQRLRIGLVQRCCSHTRRERRDEKPWTRCSACAAYGGCLRMKWASLQEKG